MQETQEMWVSSLGQEDPLEEEMATHSSVSAEKISWVLAGYRPWGCKEWGVTEQPSVHTVQEHGPSSRFFELSLVSFINVSSAYKSFTSLVSIFYVIFKGIVYLHLLFLTFWRISAYVFIKYNILACNFLLR